MSSLRYLLLLAAATVMLTAATVAFVLTIDPYEVMTDSIRRSFNAVKMEDKWQDGRAMRLAILLQQPKTVVLGSSRVVLGYDVAPLKGTEYWPAYNGATYNSSLAHRLAMLKYAATVDRQLKHVFVEIFPMDLMHTPHFWRLEPMEMSALGLVREASPLLFSSTAVRDAWEVLSTNVWSRYRKTPLQSHRPLRATPNPVVRRVMPFTALRSYKMFPPEAVLDAHWRSDVQRIVTACREYRLDCRLFLSPMDARILYGYYRFGRVNVVEQLKRALASVDGVYDFLWLNRLTAETSDGDYKLDYWIDPVHHTVDIGQLVLNSIAGKEPPKAEPGETFFTILSEHTVDAELALLHSRLDRWIAANPDVESTYSAVLSNLSEMIIQSNVTTYPGEVRVQVGNKTWLSNGAHPGGHIMLHQFSALTQDNIIFGWAADLTKRQVAERVAIVFGGSVVAWARPFFNISDHHTRPDVPPARSGFYFSYRIPADVAVDKKVIRVFSLFTDGSASEITPESGNVSMKVPAP